MISSNLFPMQLLVNLLLFRFASLLGIALVFLNLGNRTGGVSAYSVFNREGRYLLGDLRLSQIERELRHGGKYTLQLYRKCAIFLFCWKRGVEPFGSNASTVQVMDLTMEEQLLKCKIL